MWKGVVVEYPFTPLESVDKGLLPNSFSPQRPHSRTLLAWILRQIPQKHISKEERLSLARLLLENGANPNTLSVPDPPCQDEFDKSSLLYTCILNYDVEAVKLLLLHEADMSVVDHQLIFHVLMTEQIRGGSAMSNVLKEYDVQTLWPIDLISARLVMQSGCSIGIGSSKIGTIVGRALPKMNPFLRRDSWSYHSSESEDSRRPSADSGSIEIRGDED